MGSLGSKSSKGSTKESLMNSDATAGIVEMNERENVTKAEERNDKRTGSTIQARTRFASYAFIPFVCQQTSTRAI